MNMLIAMALASILCIGIGVYPYALYAILPFAADFVPYTTTHVITQLQLLMFSALAFSVLMWHGLYPPELKSTNLDSDWFYRRLLPGLYGVGRKAVSHVHFRALDRAQRRLGRFINAVYRHHGPQGALARTWPVGSTVLWVAILLCVTLVFYYVE